MTAWNVRAKKIAISTDLFMVYVCTDAMNVEDAWFIMNAGGTALDAFGGIAKEWTDKQVARAGNMALSLIENGATSGTFDFGDGLTAAAARREEQAQEACFNAVEAFVAKVEGLGFNRAHAIAMLWEACEAAR